MISLQLLDRFMLLLLTASITSKTILYLRVEKDFDSIKFWHFTKADLNMTYMTELKVWRKRQNMLSSFIIAVLFVMIATNLFTFLIAS